MKKPPAQVSDHAVVRYLERVRGEDVDALRREIAQIVGEAAEAGACGVVSGGFSYRLQGGVVTTVVPAEWTREQGRRGRPRGPRCRREVDDG